MLSEAIQRSGEFLKRQLRTGDYGLACFGSDGTPRFSHNKGHVFTGFFLAEALAECLSESDRQILLTRILSEENDGLWGFSPPAPYVSPQHKVFVVDADDTAYVVRTLRRLGVNRSPERLLVFHRPEGNSFVTFNGPGAGRIATTPTAADNLAAHPEVNANVFLALRGTRFERLIDDDIVRTTQTRQGYWPSYFYPSRFFATKLFLEFIHGRAGLGNAEQRAIAFLRDSQNADGSWGEPGDPYETALATGALAVCAEFGEPFQRGVTYLLGSAGDDGSWNTRKCIWEFHDAGDVWKAYDTHGPLVTALCTVPLQHALVRVAASRG